MATPGFNISTTANFHGFILAKRGAQIDGDLYVSGRIFATNLNGDETVESIQVTPTEMGSAPSIPKTRSFQFKRPTENPEIEGVRTQLSGIQSTVDRLTASAQTLENTTTQRVQSIQTALDQNNETVKEQIKESVDQVQSSINEKLNEQISLVEKRIDASISDVDTKLTQNVGALEVSMNAMKTEHDLKLSFVSLKASRALTGIEAIEASFPAFQTDLRLLRDEVSRQTSLDTIQERMNVVKSGLVPITERLHQLDLTQQEGIQKIDQRIDLVQSTLTDKINEIENILASGTFATLESTALTVSGHADLSDTFVDGGLIVSGNTNLQSTTMDGSLTVMGAVRVSDRAYLNAATVEGDLQVGSSIRTRRLDTEEIQALEMNVHRIHSDANITFDAPIVAREITAERINIEEITIPSVSTMILQSDVLQTTGNALFGGNITVSQNMQVQGDMIVQGSFCVNDLRFNELSLMSDLTVHGETHLENTMVAPLIQVDHLQTNYMQSHGGAIVEKDLRVDGDLIVGGRITVSGQSDYQQSVLASPFVTTNTSYVDLDGFTLTSQISGNYLIHMNVEHVSSGTNQSNTYALVVNGNPVMERSDTVVNFGHPQIMSITWYQYLDQGAEVRVQVRSSGSKSTVVRGNFILQGMK